MEHLLKQSSIFITVVQNIMARGLPDPKGEIYDLEKELPGFLVGD